LCESEEQTSLVVEEWEDVEDVECEVDGHTPRHPGPEPAAEFEPATISWVDRPEVSESRLERSD
jgi:hypothetical protein